MPANQFDENADRPCLRAVLKIMSGATLAHLKFLLTLKRREWVTKLAVCLSHVGSKQPISANGS